MVYLRVLFVLENIAAAGKGRISGR